MCNCKIPDFAPTVISADWTVNDVMRCCPAAVGVLNDLGIDTCCGGSETLAVAAQDAGLTTDALLTALVGHVAGDAAATDAGTSCGSCT